MQFCAINSCNRSIFRLHHLWKKYKIEGKTRCVVEKMWITWEFLFDFWGKPEEKIDRKEKQWYCIHSFV
ncbi:MAG: hypothetical protein A3E07_01385 [Candidatus Wildermuthbacteria bacterium RIFCSPHIGHO2_12_FULL_45_9]|nr:MAG: hypothetical protein A3E07_01385 [Candidatus Wildermuthbacteria bacterium RIFCSPHIGHO2_12_FULL_45_9]